MKKLTLGLSATAIALIGAAALAQAGPMGAMKMDPMGDKTVTKAEAQAMAVQMFDKMDANHDGKLDQADRDAHRAERRAKMFDQLDTDKNGAISRDEFNAAHKDGGKDGGMGGWGHDGDKDHGGPGMGHGGRMGHGGGMMMAKMADTNQDGAIGKDEFLAAHAKHFDMADANHDGKLTPDERKAAHQKMRDMMGKMHGKRDGGPMAGMHQGMDMPPPPPGQ